MSHEGTLFMGAEAGPTDVDRSTNGGRTWTRGVFPQGATVLFQSTLPALGGALFSDTGVLAARSDADGVAGSWRVLGGLGGYPSVYGEVPPSPAYPDGRLLAGVWNGITVSDNGGQSWRPTSFYGPARAIVYSLTALPDAGHPYGGTLWAGADDLAFDRDSTATVYRSDDGGATWTRVHRFSPAALDLPDANDVEIIATPDGALWAGLGDAIGGTAPDVGRIARSTDGGYTWARADAGYGGWSVRDIKLARDGRLYVATDGGVWRTTAPVYTVADEPAVPVRSSGVSVRAQPNPSAGAFSVVVTLAEAIARARVEVRDVRGRRLRVLHDGALPAGTTYLAVPAGSWASGVVVVRVEADGRRLAQTRATIMR